jgi:hypothetical protein
MFLFSQIVIEKEFKYSKTQIILALLVSAKLDKPFQIKIFILSTK